MKNCHISGLSRMEKHTHYTSDPSWPDLVLTDHVLSEGSRVKNLQWPDIFNHPNTSQSSIDAPQAPSRTAFTIPFNLPSQYTNWRRRISTSFCFPLRSSSLISSRSPVHLCFFPPHPRHEGGSHSPDTSYGRVSPIIFSPRGVSSCCTEPQRGYNVLSPWLSHGRLREEEIKVLGEGYSSREHDRVSPRYVSLFLPSFPPRGFLPSFSSSSVSSLPCLLHFVTHV